MTLKTFMARVEEDFSVSEDDINEAVTLIFQHNAKRVGLQVDCSLIGFSLKIYDLLRNRLEKAVLTKSTEKITLFILTDNNSYSPCCVDIVNAKHYHTEFIIYFGDPCFSRLTEFLPLYYLRPSKFLDVNKCANAIGDILQKFLGSPKPRSIWLIYDASYSAVHEDLKKAIAERLSECIDIEQICIGKVPKGSTDISYELWFLERQIESLALQTLGNTSLSSPQNFAAKTQRPGQNHIMSSFSDDRLLTVPIYIGKPDLEMSAHFLKWALRCGSIGQATVYDPESDSVLDASAEWRNQLRRFLARRYAVIRKCESAQTIGLVYLSMGSKLTRTIQKHLCKLCQNAKIQVITLVMKKPDITKFSNFPLIDCFCVIGCLTPHMFTECRASFQPVIIPYELEVILGYREWSTDYIVNLEEFNTSECLHPLAERNGQDEDTKVSVVHYETALAQREKLCPPLATLNFRGVPYSCVPNNPETSVIYEGRKGIAAEYSTELTG